jgi:predicted metal-binding protein
MKKVKAGIIICDRYNTCAGGKCFRSVAAREGAFSIYKNMELEIAAFTTCGGCIWDTPHSSEILYYTY